MYCCYCMNEKGDAVKCPFCGHDDLSPVKPYHLIPGTVLKNNYIIGRALGEGGFGITYIGRDQTLDTRVAVKEYYPYGISVRNNERTSEVTVSSDDQKKPFEDGKKSYLREARNLARFENEPGIVNVKSFFEENNTAYIVMEYLEGINLREYLSKHGTMQPDEAFRMLLPVMRSLEAIHQAGIIHRDISPDNIMYLNNGQLKLMDFGAARVFEDDSRSMSVMLKKGYAPEEQYRRNGEQGPWTDVYGICATIYRCITGRTPVESLDRIFDDSLMKPSECGVKISPALEDVLMYGLAVRKQDRCRSMTELIRLITQALGKPDDQSASPAALVNTTVTSDDNLTLPADMVSDKPAAAPSPPSPPSPPRPVMPKNAYPEPAPASQDDAPQTNAAPKKKLWIKLLAAAVALTLIVTGVVVLFATTGRNPADSVVPASGNHRSNHPSDANEANPTNGMKVGFILNGDENSTYDLNFINAAKSTCGKLGVECILKTNVSESDECKEAAEELAEQGCGFIFADSFGHEPYMIEAAREYPDVQFAQATGTRAHTEGLENYHNAFASVYEGRYLSGIAAGMKLNEMIEEGKITAEQAKIGYVGAYAYTEVISGYTAFFLGARSVCPSATMEVQFTGSWINYSAELEAASEMIHKGCVLISQHADSMGAPTACEDAGVPNVTYNGSTLEPCPNTYIISSGIDWKPYFGYAIRAVMNGDPIETDYIGSLTTGSVVMTDVNEKAAAAGTADKIAEVKAGLEEGAIHVFDTSTFTVDGKEVTEYMADVDTDEAYEGDTNVISKGYFHESEYRSAPYFDLRIDGITLLNEMY